MPYVSSPVRPVGFEVWSPEDGMLPAQVVLPTPAGPAALRRPLVEANRAWLTRMGVCRPGDRTSRALDLASFEDLAALVFRDDTEEHLLLATQLLTIVYLLDDQVDSPRSPVGSDPHAGRAVCDAVLAALAGQLNAMALVPPAVRSPAVRALIRAFSDVGRRLAALPGDRDPFLEAIAVWLDGVRDALEADHRR
ncbi:MAG TPA: hypothetical protein PKA64_19670, partial [Myxococcota bacterium]|nr:hypothetical protein [Myxococcota bacterium]